MTSKDFILSKINHILDNFPKMIVRYEYDISCDSHFIEISPSDYFDTNKEYISIEKEINHEFLKLFPFDILTFVSDKDGISLHSPLVFRKKRKKKEVQRYNTFNFENIIGSLFDDYKIDWDDNINFITSICEDDAFDIITNSLSINTKKIKTPKIYSETKTEIDLRSNQVDISNDISVNDYSLAA